MYKKLRIGRVPKNDAERAELLHDLNDNALDKPASPDHQFILLILISSTWHTTFPSLFSMNFSRKKLLFLKKLITISTHNEQNSIHGSWLMDQVLVYAISAQYLQELLHTDTLHTYYNKVMHNNINQQHNYETRNNNFEEFSCALYDRKSFKIPKLKRIVTIFLHRNLGLRYQQNLTHSICDFSPQLHILENLKRNAHCPSTHLKDLEFLATHCPIHDTNKVTRVNEKHLNKYNILIIQNGEFFHALLSAGVSPKQLNRIFSVPEIHCLAFDKLYLSPRDLPKILNYLDTHTIRIQNFDPPYIDYFVPQ